MNDLMTKSFLNYVELKRQAQKDLECGQDFEMAGINSEDPNLKQFFAHIGAIKAEMEVIESLLIDLQKLHEESKSTHSPKILRGLRDQMDSNMVSILRKARIIKSQLEILDRSNGVKRSLLPECQLGSPIDRTRISVTNGVRAKLRDLMNDFQLLRERIITEHKEGLRRRYFSATGVVASEETIEKMIAGGSKIEAFEKKAEMNLENQERLEAVKQLQRSMLKLHQLFLDMAVLVENQGEKLNDIEQNVVCATDYISSGNQGLASANMMGKKGRKFRVYFSLALVLLLILLIVFVVLISS